MSTPTSPQARLESKLKRYIGEREHAVRGGRETPAFAALQLQTYGNGLLDAMTYLFNDERALATLQILLDDAVMQLDPTWRVHTLERWNAQSVGVAILPRPPETSGAPIREALNG